MDIRASRIQGEYQLLAKKVDLELGHPSGQGPTTRKLSQFPPVLDLCFGAYGETSEGVKSLLDMLVDARVRKLGLTRGTAEVGKETALTKGYLRRRLSSATIKGQCGLSPGETSSRGGGRRTEREEKALG